MIVIGINDTHDASACIIKNGELLDAVLEKDLLEKKYKFFSNKFD